MLDLFWGCRGRNPKAFKEKTLTFSFWTCEFQKRVVKYCCNFVRQRLYTKKSLWYQPLKILLMFYVKLRSYTIAIKLLLWCGSYTDRRFLQLFLVMLIGDPCTLKFATLIDPCNLKKFAINQSKTGLELS